MVIYSNNESDNKLHRQCRFVSSSESRMLFVMCHVNETDKDMVADVSRGSVDGAAVVGPLYFVRDRRRRTRNCSARQDYNPDPTLALLAHTTLLL